MNAIVKKPPSHNDMIYDDDESTEKRHVKINVSIRRRIARTRQKTPPKKDQLINTIN